MTTGTRKKTKEDEHEDGCVAEAEAAAAAADVAAASALKENEKEKWGRGSRRKNGETPRGRVVWLFLPLFNLRTTAAAMENSKRSEKS